MLEHLIGRGAVENAREGIRHQEDGRKPQRDKHDHRQRAQTLTQATAARTALVERKLLRIRILLHGLRFRCRCRRHLGCGILRYRLGSRSLHLHLHESLLLTQHALGLLLRGLEKQIHAGLQNRSIRRLRPASRTTTTATTQSLAIATKFLLPKSCRKAQQLPHQHFL